MTKTTETTAKFDQIIDLEQTVRILTVAEQFAPNAKSDHHRAATATSLETHRAKLYAAVEALTDEEAVAFGAYRASL